MADNRFLYFSVKNQNDALISRKQDLVEKYSIDNQKIFYELQEIAYMKYINSILFIVFYIVFIIVAFFIFRQNISTYLKFIYIIVLGLYPFYIMSLEKFIYNSFGYMNAYFNGNIYRKWS